MESNKKIKTHSLELLILSISINYKVFIRLLSLFNVYDNYDISGLAKPVQITMALATLIISATCVYKTFKGKEVGIDSLFNKMMIVTFIIYTIVSISSFVFIRYREEKIAMKMKEDIETITNTYNETQKNKNKKKDDTSKLKVESQFILKDENYIRKKEIISQVENSSSLERYFSMLIHRINYKYYSATRSFELDYYQIFLFCAVIGIYGAIKFTYFEYNRKRINILDYE